MSIIDKYLTREIFKQFGLVLTAVVGIYIAVDIFENVDKFLESELPVTRIITYILLKLPLIFNQIIPVAILLAILVAFGLMNKNNEITALKCGGVSVYYLLRPIVTIGLVFAGILFVLSESIVPITISKANYIWRVEIKKKTSVTARQKNIWIKGHRSISYISYFNPKDLTISGVTLNYFDHDFNLIRRVDGSKGKFQDGQWVLFDLMEQVLDTDSGTYRVHFHQEQEQEIDFLPEDLKRAAKKSEEMNFKELYAYVQAVESEGYDATPYRVDFHAKFALPVACFILCLIATGIAAKRRSREALSIVIAYGIGIVFLYWILHGFCLSLGYGGVLPPVFAAWISNFVFTCFAVFNLLTAE